LAAQEVGRFGSYHQLIRMEQYRYRHPRQPAPASARERGARPEG